MPSNPLLPQELLLYIQASAQNGIVPPNLPSGYVYATPPTSDGHLYLRRFDAAYIQTGIIDPNRLGTGSTGAGNLYLADDGTWKPVGGGGGGGADMLKATYDVDNDGVVDSAERTEIIVRNSTGSTLTKGTIVYLSGATGNRPNALRAQAHTEATSSKTIGMVEADISNNSDGYVATNGTLHDLDTSAFTAGDAVWLSATTAGAMTSTIPAEPNHTVFIGYIARAHPTQGRLVILIQNGYELNELHGVQISSEANNDLLVYETSTTLWKNKSISTIFGGTPLVSVPTLAQVTTAGNTTTNSITVGRLVVNTSSLVVFPTTFNVGINTATDAGYKLDVNGTVRVQGNIDLADQVNRYIYGFNGSYIKFYDSLTGGLDIYNLNGTSTTRNYGSLAVYGNFSTTGSFSMNGNLNIGGGNFLAADSSTLNRIYPYNGANANMRFVLGHPTTGDFDWEYPINTVLVRLKRNGNFLIGTTTDAGYKLDVNGSARVSSLGVNGFDAVYSQKLYVNGNIRIQDGNGIGNTNTSTGEWIKFSSVSGLVFGTNSTERLRIDTTGNVGIGTTTPTEKLEVNGNIKATSFIKSGGTSSQFLKADGSVDSTVYYAASNPSGYTTNVGTVTSVATGTGLSGGTITGSGTISLANTAVTAGAYTNANITVDAQGRITAASNGSGGGGSTSTISIGPTSSSNVYSSGSVVGHMKFEYWSTDNPASGKQETGVLYVTYYPGPIGGFNYWLDVQTTTPDSTAPLSFTITGGPTLDINITNPNPYGVDITYKITTF